MREHASATLITTRKPLPTPPASSLIILSQTSHATPVAAKNPLFDNAATHKHNYAMDMDLAYDYPSSGLPLTERQDNSQKATTFLTGPLVFRVRPDGSPVEEDQRRALPRDDDLEHFLHTTINNNNNNNNKGRQNKHRKIATISALKQQHLATLSEQHTSQVSRLRRQYPSPAIMFANYYARRQA